jgi:ATP-binding cassette subfamily C (CFTR/MRP) protein 1
MLTSTTDDRIVVMSDGQIAEFDSPMNLFNTPGGIFQGMCVRSNIHAEDFERPEFEGVPGA